MKIFFISCALLVLGSIAGIYAVLAAYSFDGNLEAYGSSLNKLIRECRHLGLTAIGCVDLINGDSLLGGQFDIVSVDESTILLEFRTIQSGSLFSRQAGYWTAQLEKDPADRIVRSRTEFVIVQSAR